MTKVLEGSVHGRFQPFHNEHLDYVLEAKRRCEFLYIGVTKFDILPAELTHLGGHRDEPQNNPLTYYERLKAISRSLLDAGMPAEEFTFVPFPIENPSSLGVFLPTSVVCFTTICDEWNLKKIAVLEKHGYPVDVLWRRDKKITGTEVRELLASGDDRWRGLVPDGTARVIADFDIAARIRELRALP